MSTLLSPTLNVILVRAIGSAHSHDDITREEHEEVMNLLIALNSPAPRYAVIYSSSQSEIARYLPSRYKVLGQRQGDDGVVTLIGGYDNAGWTLDGYVLPRLGSGMYPGEELTAEQVEHYGLSRIIPIRTTSGE